jgi:hypothetical protein
MIVRHRTTTGSKDLFCHTRLHSEPDSSAVFPQIKHQGLAAYSYHLRTLTSGSLCVWRQRSRTYRNDRSIHLGQEVLSVVIA